MSQHGSVFLYHPETAQQQVDDHARIIGLIADGSDPDVVEEALRQHTQCLVHVMRSPSASDPI
jgi:DNA-binding GntR family transcriptional regulator